MLVIYMYYHTSKKYFMSINKAGWLVLLTVRMSVMVKEESTSQLLVPTTLPPA